MGAYLQDPNYASQAEDILVNTIRIELDISVLSAIRSSFEKQKNLDDRKRIIEKLLALNSMSFSYVGGANQWSKLSAEEYDLSYAKFKSDLGLLKQEYNVDIDKLPVELIAEVNNLKEKNRMKSQASMQYMKLPVHEEIIAGFITSLLNNSLKNPIENLEFFQNSFNYQALINVKLINPSIVNSALSRATMSRFNLVGISKCLIENTTFEFSAILDSSFINCEIKQTLFSGNSTKLKNVSFTDSSFDNVFFYYADISDSDFRDVKGLKPEYFYAAVNYHKAKFSDDNFIDEIVRVNETPGEFVDFLQKNSFSTDMSQSICKDLFEAEELTCPLSY